MDEKTKDDKKQQYGIWLGMPPQVREPSSAKELALNLGVTNVTLSAWNKDPIVISAKENSYQLMALGSNLEIWNKLVAKAKQGDTQAIRLYMQLTGQLKERDTSKKLPRTIKVTYVSDSS